MQYLQHSINIFHNFDVMHKYSWLTDSRYLFNFQDDKHFDYFVNMNIKYLKWYVSPDN